MECIDCLYLFIYKIEIFTYLRTLVVSEIFCNIRKIIGRMKKQTICCFAVSQKCNPKTGCNLAQTLAACFARLTFNATQRKNSVLLPHAFSVWAECVHLNLSDSRLHISNRFGGILNLCII